MQTLSSLVGTPYKLNRPARSAPAQPYQHQRNVASRRADRLVRSALIGDVNDPEKSKDNKRKKEHDSEWAEPGNKNPLEKKTVAHGGSEAKAEAGSAGDKVKEAVDKAADAVKGATNQ